MLEREQYALYPLLVLGSHASKAFFPNAQRSLKGELRTSTTNKARIQCCSHKTAFPYHKSLLCATVLRWLGPVRRRGRGGQGVGQQEPCSLSTSSCEPPRWRAAWNTAAHHRSTQRHTHTPLQNGSGVVRDGSPSVGLLRDRMMPVKCHRFQVAFTAACKQ